MSCSGSDRQQKTSYLLPLCVSVSLLVSCALVSQKKFFWADELLSFYLINDQSFFHMLQALTDTINNAPPFYFALGWVWDKLFPSTALSLRLLSSLSICLAQLVVWLTLRRTYHFLAASLGTVAVFCGSALILEQNAEARFYGLFLAVCALGFCQFDLLCRSGQATARLIVANLFIHMAMVHTHIYGLLYSCATLVALVIHDTYDHIVRPKVYVSILVAWLSLLPWLPALLNQAEIGQPRSWFPPPGPRLLADTYDAFTVSYVFPWLLIIAGLSLLHHSRKSPDVRTQDYVQEQGSARVLLQTRGERSLLILALCWLAVPVAAWLISWTVQPIFWKRYLIPTQLSFSMLVAAWVSRMLMLTGAATPSAGRSALRRLPSVMLMLLLPLLIIHPLYYGKDQTPEQFPGSQDKNFGYHALPIVVDFMLPFMKRFHYSPEQHRYFFLLDWQVAVAKTSGLVATGEYKVMDALQRNYPHIFHNNILQSQEFLNTHERFLVLKDRTTCTSRDIICSKWYESRIENNAQYSAKKLGDIDKHMEILLVEKHNIQE